MSVHEAPRLLLTLLLGGVRSGKSARALLVAHECERTQRMVNGSTNVTFVATAQAFDAEMDRRISLHRAERPSCWNTIEEPVAVSQAIEQHLEQQPDVGVVVIDCITLWVSNLLLQHEQPADIEVAMAGETRSLLDMMRRNATVTTSAATFGREWIIVSNEVGLGVVPPTVLGRQYRDALGRANQLLAAAASEATLLVAGLAVALKSRQ